MTAKSADELWLGAQWEFVRANLPPEPARVVEVGCGPLGGFVPAMQQAGYDSLGVDPEAPTGTAYIQSRFEDATLDDQTDCVIACVSLHHVADIDDVVGKIGAVLRAAGTLIVVEWAWERFDDATAQWCFARLRDEHGWLQQHRDRWKASGDDWQAYLRTWAGEERLHPSADIVKALERRFRTAQFTRDAYLFPELEPPDPAAERAAIVAGDIQATGIRYVGTRL